MTAAVFNPELDALVEKLAVERCSHHQTACEACTNLAVEAVATFRDSGWWAQQVRFRNRVPRRGATP